jgi:hypothetical protein
MADPPWTIITWMKVLKTAPGGQRLKNLRRTIRLPRLRCLQALLEKSQELPHSSD